MGYSQLFSSHVANAPQLGRTVEDAWRYGSKNLQNYKFFDTLDDAKAWAFSTARTVGFTVAEATKFKNSRTKTFLQFVTECGEDPATIMHKYPIVPPPSKAQRGRTKRRRSSGTSATFTAPRADTSSSILGSLARGDAVAAAAAERRAAAVVALMTPDMAAACASPATTP